MANDMKYGKVTTEHGKFDDDEPVFVLRGQDVLALETLIHYREQADRFGCSAKFRDDVNREIGRFSSWSGVRTIPD